MADGSLIGRERGTPQGGVVSPLLANLFLHYAFDMWIRRNHPGVPFERFADDAICHCRSEQQARGLCHGNGRATKRGVRADQVSRGCDGV
jgi:retron-type reverse transcriptase